MSEQIEDIAVDWAKVQEDATGWSLPKLARAWVRATEEAFDATHEEEALRAADEGRGWVRFQSAAYEGTAWSGVEAARGRLLAGEWAGEDGHSWRLSPAPSGRGQRLLRLEEFREPNGEAQPVLAETRLLRGHREKRDLQYRVYWAAPGDDPGAMRRLFARFLGFGDQP